MNQMVLENSKISIKEVQKIVALNYDIKGSVKKLDGEIDFNFKIQSTKGKNYLLKISRPNFESDYIDFQIKLLDHLNKNCEIEIAENKLTIDGNKSCIIKDNQGEIDLLDFCLGQKEDYGVQLTQLINL